MLILILAAVATMVATGLGVIPVLLLGDRAVALRSGMWGLSVGVMSVAAVVGLLIPAFDEGDPTQAIVGLVTGVAFLMLAQRWLKGRGDIRFAGQEGAGVRASLLVFSVLFVHSLPEGMALGSAYGSDVSGLALFVFLAIAIQNIPEGTAVAIPMEEANYSASKQFWAATLTSLPQPIGAVLAYVLVEEVAQVLPFSLAFAGGAMLALIVIELIPDAIEAGKPGQAVAGGVIGGAVMLALGILLGVS